LIRTERLLLRKPRLEDAEALLPAYSDPETMRFIGDGSTTDLDGMHAGPEEPGEEALDSSLQALLKSAYEAQRLAPEPKAPHG